jgi:hypothetical protein
MVITYGSGFTSRDGYLERNYLIDIVALTTELAESEE